MADPDLLRKAGGIFFPIASGRLGGRIYISLCYSDGDGSTTTDQLAEVARRVGSGERAVHTIVKDLVEAGYVRRTRQGNHNVYEVFLDRPLRHPLEASHRLDEIIEPLTR